MQAHCSGRLVWILVFSLYRARRPNDYFRSKSQRTTRNVNHMAQIMPYL
jgi:hypothetical protein